MCEIDNVYNNTIFEDKEIVLIFEWLIYLLTLKILPEKQFSKSISETV